VISDKRDVPRLCATSVRIWQIFSRGCQRQREDHTPFMRGINEEGSVDMDASSINTTGKSAALSAWHADVIHVVQI